MMQFVHIVSISLCVLKSACLRRLKRIVSKKFEITEKLYLSKALLKMAGGGRCIPHIPPLDPPLDM